MKGEVLKGKLLMGEPRRMLTRPGRLRARSGSKLPTANVPLRALEDGVQKIEVRATFFAILRFGLGRRGTKDRSACDILCDIAVWFNSNLITVRNHSR